jgi:hypothetical protein
MNIFKNTLKITVVIALLFLFSCKKEPNEKQNEPNVNTLTDEIDKVVTIYQEGDIKLENIVDPDYKKIETSAPESYKEKVRQELEKSYSKQTTYLKSANNTVGVIRSGTCGSYQELYVHMDCEDSGAASSYTGWTGDCLVNSSKNIILRFCVVSGVDFGPTTHNYAILNLGFNALPIGVTRVVRLFDNEDTHNKNSATIAGSTVGLVGDCNFYYDTQLSFYLYPGDPSYTTPLPNLGFTYGVFGNWASTDNDKGKIFSDDEDNNNGNELYWQVWDRWGTLQPRQDIQGITSIIMKNGANTDIYINKVN